MAVYVGGTDSALSVRGYVRFMAGDRILWHYLKTQWFKAISAGYLQSAQFARFAFIYIQQLYSLDLGVVLVHITFSPELPLSS